MKVGFIFECGPEGADKKVFDVMVKKISGTEVDFIPTTLNDKRNLINQCAQTTLSLLNDSKCEKVFIVWDLTPPDKGACRKKDREEILNKLNESSVPIDKVVLLCIEQELESWLIADGRALSEFLSKPTHKVVVSDEKRPDIVKNPKKRLVQEFTKHRGKQGKYIDYVHAEKIAQLISDFQKLRKSETFKRFYYKLTNSELT